MTPCRGSIYALLLVFSLQKNGTVCAMSVLNMLRMLKFAKIMPVFAELALCKNMLKFSGIVKATQSELRQVHEI